MIAHKICLAVESRTYRPDEFIGARKETNIQKSANFTRFHQPFFFFFFCYFKATCGPWIIKILTAILIWDFVTLVDYQFAQSVFETKKIFRAKPREFAKLLKTDTAAAAVLESLLCFLPWLLEIHKLQSSSACIVTGRLHSSSFRLKC